MSLELTDWQKRVIYGTEPRLAVPSGYRSGKDYAVAHAMKERKTLVIVPVESLRQQMLREAKYRGVVNPNIEAYDPILVARSVFDQYEQVIFNEIARLKRDPRPGMDILERLLIAQDGYKGRIIAIGTPVKCPDPIFKALVCDHGWPYVQGKPYISEEQLKEVEALVPPSVYKAQWQAQFMEA